MRQINKEGLELVKEFEGCELKAYLCPAGVWTIGYGHTFSVEMGQVISEVEAEALLRDDLANAEEAVDRLVAVPINENQFSALVSLAFNIGAFISLAGEEKSAFERSTLLKMLNANAGAETVAAQFLRWNKVGDEEMSGLTRRRHAERALFLGADWKNYLS